MVKLSVIIPYRPGEPGLDSCLASIRSSVGDGPCEIIDIAGPDGVSIARNTGLALATGEWVAWVDADDRVEPGWFSTLQSAIAEYHSDVITFGAKEDERTILYRSQHEKISALDFLVDVLRDIRTSSWLWNKAFRRSLFEGLVFEGRTQEDFRMMPQVLGRAEYVASIPDVLYVYNRPAGSLSRHADRSISSKGLLECLDIPMDRYEMSIQHAWEVGLALRIADFLRHGGEDVRLQGWLRQHCRAVFRDGDLSLKAKFKCFLARMGL